MMVSILICQMTVKAMREIVMEVATTSTLLMVACLCLRWVHVVNVVVVKLALLTFAGVFVSGLPILYLAFSRTVGSHPTFGAFRECLFGVATPKTHRLLGRRFIDITKFCAQSPLNGWKRWMWILLLLLLSLLCDGHHFFLIGWRLVSREFTGLNRYT